MTHLRALSLPVAALVLLALLVSGCALLRSSIPSPTARVDGVDIDGVSLTAVTLRFDIEVENPYGTALPVVGLDYALSTGGERFIDGDIEAEASIPARGSGIVPMRVRLPYQALRDVGRQVKPGARIPYRADLALKVNTPILGILRLPMDAESEIAIPSLP